MVGQTISHYKILDKLGEGGMGVVYKAQDLRLGRTVALKFLPRSVTINDEQRRRFEIEARAAATLNHPNIAQIYAIEEAGDDLFIAMEYVAGRDLKSRINASPLPLAEALSIAEQIALGLQAAHRRGIVHRDIKSANIMVADDGQVKIMDFGLAKVEGAAGVTTVGTTVGTTAYMSPEQTRGEDVDQQSDIWSLGVVLYEMLTGRLPFGVQYEQAVIYAIQNSDPEPVSVIRPGVPADVEHIVDRALRKERGERFHDADAMLAEFQRARAGEPPGSGRHTGPGRGPASKKKFLLAAAGAVLLVVLAVGYLLLTRGPGSDTLSEQDAPELRRLAVLPFSNIREDPQTEFLSFALADQIIGDLAYVRTVLVRPSSMIRTFQKEPVDPASAGRLLNVDYILTGNYLKEADTIRLNLELVDLQTQNIVWHEQVQARYENAFKLQDIVTEKVIHGLQVRFSSGEQRQIQTDVPRSSEAYEYYLRSIAMPLTIQGDEGAVALLKKAIELDSTYAPTYGELGYRLNQIGSYAFGGSQNLLEAEQAFLKGLSLNNGLLKVWANLTTFYTDRGRTEEAFETARRVLDLNPNDPDGHFALGYVYRYAGLNEEAEGEMEKAVRLDPRNPRYRSLGVTYVYNGKYEEALQALDLDPESAFSLGWKAEIYMRMGKKEQAMRYLDTLLNMNAEELLKLWGTTEKAYLEGNHALALSTLEKWGVDSTADGEILYNAATHRGLLGDTAGCIRTLRMAINNGFFNYPRMLSDPFFDSVRGNKAFHEVLETARAKHEAFRRRL